MTEPITYLGPPGTGKTQNLSNLIRNCLEDNIPPERIACVSFTRKAAEESRERVCKDWGLEEDSLPHFQTLHAMAFRSGGYKVDNVMRGSDLKALGKSVGLLFTESKKNDLESDFDILGYSKGDMYLNIYQLSRSLRISLEESYRQAGNYDMHWSELTRLVDAYNNYKKVHRKIDFTDMIENFVARGEPLDIDALFVDEAQDLSTLQWEMIDVLRLTPEVQVFTGDDDQAIMNFQGADVNAFLTATDKKQVLTQSYRLPRRVWEEAQRIVSRIEGRAPKRWSPRDEEGSVHYYQNFWDVPFDEGEWCILARTNFIATKYANKLREEGWVYSRHGRPSIDSRIYDAILSWEKLAKGNQISIAELRSVYMQMTSGEDYVKGFGPRCRSFLDSNQEELIDIDMAADRFGLRWKLGIRWHEALTKIDIDTKNYILNALRRGDNVKHPRIKVSTIHSMKGGECDNVLVIPELSYAAYKTYQKNPSIEHRVFYVAVTRAKQSLHIMEPTSELYYEL